MKKSRWKRFLRDIYQVELAPKLRGFRGSVRPKDLYPIDTTEYVRLIQASRTISFLEEVPELGPSWDAGPHADLMRIALTDLLKAHQRVNIELLTESGIVDVFDEYLEEILAELEIEDLPEADLIALGEAGSVDPRAELMLRIKKIRHYFLSKQQRTDTLTLSRAATEAGERNGVRLAQFADKPRRQSSNIPPRQRSWFKGLGSICRGTVLTAVDVSLLGSWWSMQLSPDTTVVGSMASIATGLGDIAVGIGEFREE